MNYFPRYHHFLKKSKVSYSIILNPVQIHTRASTSSQTRSKLHFFLSSTFLVFPFFLRPKARRSFLAHETHIAGLRKLSCMHVPAPDGPSLFTLDTRAHDVFFHTCEKNDFSLNAWQDKSTNKRVCTVAEVLCPSNCNDDCYQ